MGSIAVWKGEVALLFGAQFGSTARTTAEGFEDEVGAVDFHLVNHLKEFAEASFGPPGFVGEPGEVFSGQIVDGKALRGEMGGAKLAKRHVGSADGVEISAHGFLQGRLPACGLRKFIGHGLDYRSGLNTLPARIVDQRVTLARVQECR